MSSRKASLHPAAWGRGLTLFALASVLLVLFAGCSRTEGQSRADYLNPELRSAVEKLEAAVAAGPTSVENAPQHSATLWKWANAYSLEGGVIPVDLPSNVRQVTLAALAKRPVPDGLRRRLDLYVRELELKEEEPGALGTLRFASAAPIEAASFTTVEEIYTVGSRALERGATILVGRQMMPDQGEAAARGSGRGPLRLDSLLEPGRALGQAPRTVRWHFTPPAARINPTSPSGSRRDGSILDRPSP